MDDLRSLRERLIELEHVVRRRYQDHGEAPADRDIVRMIQIPSGGIGAGQSAKVRYYENNVLTESTTTMIVFNRMDGLVGSPTAAKKGYAAWIALNNSWEIIQESCN